MANNDNVVPTQHQGDTTTMNLSNAIRVNGVLYPKGMKVEVPKAQADDIARMDYEANEQKANLVRQPQQFMGPAGINPMTGRPWEK
jgi:hypothetical protein